MIDKSIYSDDKKPLGYSIVKAEDMDSDGAMNLLYAIFDKAKTDYIKAEQKEYKTKKKDPEAERIRRWLDNGNSLLGSWLPVRDPEKVIINWNTQAEYYRWRKRNSCSRCKSKKYDKCPHRGSDGPDSGDYTKEWTCQRGNNLLKMMSERE